jgi:hypothetical protein
MVLHPHLGRSQPAPLTSDGEWGRIAVPGIHIVEQQRDHNEYI